MEKWNIGIMERWKRRRDEGTMGRKNEGAKKKNQIPTQESFLKNYIPL